MIASVTVWSSVTCLAQIHLLHTNTEYVSNTSANKGAKLLILLVVTVVILFIDINHANTCMSIIDEILQHC